MQSAEAQKDALKTDLMFEEDDAPSGKLDDAEIARLVSLSTQAAYHRTDNIPVKPKESFEPRTLVTIAMEAQRRRESELQISENEGGEVPNNTDQPANEDTEAAQKAVTLGNDVLATVTVDTDTDAAVAIDEPINGGVLLEDCEEEADEPELSEEEIAAAAAAEKIKAEYERGLAEGCAKGEETGYQAGHEKGYEAGRAAGQAEATAQLETAIKGFERATLALANTATLDLDALTASIHNAILSLASERAGITIAEMPEGFAVRIESILDTIKQGTEHPQIRLNPDDFMALKPIIATREKLQNCGLAADETLAPGDLRLVINGIGIDDELERRVGKKQAVQKEEIATSDTPSLDTLSNNKSASPPEARMRDANLVDTEPNNIKASLAESAQTAQLLKSADAASAGVGESGFSIGLKPKTEVGDASVSTIDTDDQTKVDQS